MRVCRIDGASFGGRLADRIGGIKTLSIMYTLAAAFLLIVSPACRRPGAPPAYWFLPCFHLAPEQFAHAPPSPQTDLYAAGVTLYVLLTRHFPYGEIEPFQTPRFGTPIVPNRSRHRALARQLCRAVTGPTCRNGWRTSC
jgi:hypothetical protein